MMKCDIMDISAISRSSATYDENKKKQSSQHGTRSLRKLEDFNLELVIGKGGFANVLLVSHKSTGKYYAMKVMNKSYLAMKKAFENVLRERTIMSAVDHPYIARLRMAFQNQKKLFLVLDFYPGGDLLFHMQKAKTLSRDASTFYMAEIFLAIAFLHRKSILFRDLKAENILLDAEGHIKLSDFGMSKHNSDLTWESGAYTACGTPQYMAPEIIFRPIDPADAAQREKGASYGFASDWWSSGILLYEMIAGVPPFRGRTPGEVFNNVRSRPLILLKKWDDEMKDFMRGVLAKRVDTRLGSKNGSAEILSHAFFKTYRKYATPDEAKRYCCRIATTKISECSATDTSIALKSSSTEVVNKSQNLSPEQPTGCTLFGPSARASVLDASGTTSLSEYQPTECKTMYTDQTKASTHYGLDLGALEKRELPAPIIPDIVCIGSNSGGDGGGNGGDRSASQPEPSIAEQTQLVVSQSDPGESQNQTKQYRLNVDRSRTRKRGADNKEDEDRAILESIYKSNVPTGSRQQSNRRYHLKPLSSVAATARSSAKRTMQNIFHRSEKVLASDSSSMDICHRIPPVIEGGNEIHSSGGTPVREVSKKKVEMTEDSGNRKVSPPCLSRGIDFERFVREQEEQEEQEEKKEEAGLEKGELSKSHGDGYEAYEEGNGDGYGYRCGNGHHQKYTAAALEALADLQCEQSLSGDIKRDVLMEEEGNEGDNGSLRQAADGIINMADGVDFCSNIFHPSQTSGRNRQGTAGSRATGKRRGKMGTGDGFNTLDSVQEGSKCLVGFTFDEVMGTFRNYSQSRMKTADHNNNSSVRSNGVRSSARSIRSSARSSGCKE